MKNNEEGRRGRGREEGKVGGERGEGRGERGEGRGEEQRRTESNLENQLSSGGVRDRGQ